MDTREKIAEWEIQYDKVFYTDFDGQVFIWRRLTRAEYKMLAKVYSDEMERNEQLCILCVLDPVLTLEDMDTISGGIPDRLAEEILKGSHFAATDEEIKFLDYTYNQEMEVFDNQVNLTIKEAFQDMTLKEIEDLTIEKSIEYYAKAKWILSTFRNISFESVSEQDPMI